MSAKVLLVCLALVYISVQAVPIDNELSAVGFQQNNISKIQSQCFEMLSTRNAMFLKQFEKEDNIKWSPLLVQVVLAMLSMKLFHVSPYVLLMDKNKVLQEPIQLSNTLQSFVSSSDIRFNVGNAVFLDNERVTNMESYLNDMNKYYNSKIIEVTFHSPSNTALIEAIYKWTSQKTNGTAPKINELPSTDGLDSVEVTVFTFFACWNGLAGSHKSIEIGKFKNGIDEFDVEMISAKQSIGYFDNPDLKYEAVRLPFKNEKFAAAFILPYQDQSLDIFYDFTSRDYQQLLERIFSKLQYVDYKIPKMNANGIIINKDGIGMNTNTSEVCEAPLPAEDMQTYNGNYRTFYVDRPYAYLLYHEETKLILQSAFIKHPTKDNVKLFKFEVRAKAKQEGIELSKK